MRWFYHFSPVKLRKKARNIILVTACFCAEICVAAFIVMFFNFFTARNHDVVLQMLMIICGAILLGMIVCFGAAMISWHKISRRSRYTYVDIQPKTLIYSAYAGEYTVWGEKVIIRDIYYVPYEHFSDVQVSGNGKNVIVTGKVRHYCMNSDNLGYHIKDGEVVFDRELLNESGYESLESLRIPSVFGNPERLRKSIAEGRARFEEIPAPKPYVFKEADFIRRRAKPRTMPEDFNYSRNW